MKTMYMSRIAGLTRRLVQVRPPCIGYRVRRFQTGFSLTEAMVVVAVIAILAAVAIPSFNQAIERQRILRAAEAILSDLRWARSEAIRLNYPVTVTFTTGAPWIYAITYDPDGLGGGTVLKSVSGSEFPNTTMASASFSGGVAYTEFDPARGTNARNGTVSVTSANYSAGVIVSTLGRSRVCGNFGGYSACP